MSSSLEYVTISLQLYDYVSPWFSTGSIQCLSRHSYLASKEGDAAYDQQHSVLLKPEQLLLRTLQTTTSVDPIFLKDIRISLLSNPLALKFKQSCTNSRSQNGQIKVPDFQTPDSEILDSKSPDFRNSNSRIHRSHEGERP
jgi:hypothetical protein